MHKVHGISWVVDFAPHTAKAGRVFRPPHADVEDLDPGVEETLAEPEHLEGFYGLGLQSICSPNGCLVQTIIVELDIDAVSG